MGELKMLPEASTPADLLLVYFDAERLGDYLHLAANLRAGGLAVEVFPEPKKLGQQLKYADQRGFRAAVIVGSREFDHGVVQIKNLATGEKSEVALDEKGTQIIQAVQRILASPTA